MREPTLNSSYQKQKSQGASGGAIPNRLVIPAWTYLRCTLGPVFILLEFSLLARNLGLENVRSQPILIVGVLGVCAYILYLSLKLIRDELQLRKRLSSEWRTETQTKLIQDASNLANRFFRVTFGIGIAIAALRLLFRK